MRGKNARVVVNFILTSVQHLSNVFFGFLARRNAKLEQGIQEFNTGKSRYLGTFPLRDEAKLIPMNRNRDAHFTRHLVTSPTRIRCAAKHAQPKVASVPEAQGSLNGASKLNLHEPTDLLRWRLAAAGARVDEVAEQ